MRAKTLYLLGLSSLLWAFAATVPFRGLFEPDESRYALVAKEMLEEGQWLVPHLEGRPYTHKPPLYLWLVAALRALGLPWTAAGVFPAFAAALAVLLLLPPAARRLGLDREASYLAGAALAGSPLFATMALAARMDMLLALFLGVALAAGFCVLHGETGHERWRWVFWLALGLAVMSKGPVALALVALTLLFDRVANRQPLPWRRLFSGWAWMAALAIPLAWFVPAALSQGRAWVEETLVRQSAGRMVRSFAHREPFYFHLVTWPVTGFPASLLAMLATVRLWPRAQHPLSQYVASSFAAILLFFSVISGKLVVYLLPLVPVAVVLSVVVLREETPWVSWVLGASTLLGAVLGLALALLPRWRGELPLAPGLALLLGGGLLLPSALAGMAAARGNRAAAFRLLVGAGVFFTAAVLPVVTCALDRTLSVRDIAVRYASLTGGQETGLVYRESLSGLAVFSGKRFARLENPEQLAQALAAGNPVVVTQKDWERLAASLAVKGVRMERFPYRRSALLLVYLPPEDGGTKGQ